MISLSVFGLPCTFEERELLEEARSHKGVGETEEKATEQQARGADVDGMRSGTHKTHRHLQERQRECDVYRLYVEIQGMVKGECFTINKYAVIVCVCAAYLMSQVEVTVHRQYRVCVVLGAEWKQLLAGVLEVFFQQELSWCSQEKVLAVWSTDVLRGPH